MKMKLPLLILPLIAGCAGYENIGNIDYEDYADYADLKACPKVQIRQEDRTIVQKAAGRELFKIEMVGYNGHCYYDETLQKDKAVVSPRFKITRLSDTNVEDVHFSYYLETFEGPQRFLGKKTYFAEVRMPKGSYESYHTPQAGELSAPVGEYAFEMYAGMNAIEQDSEYRK